MTTQDERSEQPSDAPEASSDADRDVADAASADPDSATGTDSPAPPDAEHFEPPRGPNRRGGKLLFVLALLPGLAALGWLTWDYFQPGHEPAGQSALEGRVEALDERLDEGLDEHRRRLSEVSSAAESLQSRVDGIDVAALQREMDGYRNDLGELERRVESRLSAMDARLDEADLTAPDAEQRIPLVEAAALLRLGADRLELAADADGARRAYVRARQRLALSDDPRTGAVDRQIVREIEAITAWRQTDWAGISGRLRALSEGASDWPLKPVAPVLDTDPEERRSLRGRLQRTLGRLVTIRRRDETELAPAEADQLRSGLKARLAAAELEAVRHDADAMAAVLEPVIDALDRYFDGEHSRMQAVRQSVSEVLEAAESEDPPAVGEAARQLQALLER